MWKVPYAPGFTEPELYVTWPKPNCAVLEPMLIVVLVPLCDRMPDVVKLHCVFTSDPSLVARICESPTPLALKRFDPSCETLRTYPLTRLVPRTALRSDVGSSGM